ncbi:HlyD family efflux transporter periplasmic adaptor subunit [Alteromonas sediminis]|uniref:HlyD family efflux transporter periplasmic adaptor subunit n=1 Tax=Alteromonas sediminis TaxID=2259342 RepID=A0A3N5YNG1_9ALTE|nr:PilZ domain-containing protein [Alteromonas sediminis]RPJ67141.1 HlyD family efflux transporter periplasmic adaptor subunit [Alteromonas sediminis]
MNTGSDSNSLVHESETQRRHSRVKIPSTLVMKNEQGEEKKYPLLDISASGFAISGEELELTAGDVRSGIVHFQFDSLEIGLKVNFQVVAKHGNDPVRYGCEFHNLGREEISTLRTIITKFLSGEVTQLDDILTTLSRENFAKERVDFSKALSGSEKLRALIFTGVFVFLSLLAFAYVLFSIHQSFFVIKADTAIVSAQTSVATSPRSGPVTLKVKEGDKVSIGQPIAVIESPALSDTSSIASAAGISDEDLNALLGKTVSSVIESRCNCEVVSLRVSEGEFVSAGQTIANFGEDNTQTIVLARFAHDVLQDIAEGTKVDVYISPEQGQISGVITKLQVPEPIRSEEHRVHSVLATITTDEAIPFKYLNRPVTVKVGELSGF